MKRIIIVATILLFSLQGIAQQDPMLTQYMFNTLSYNPAYAGSRDGMSISILHRDQWLGFNDNEGKPVTQIFSMHTPVRSDRVGFGLTVSRDVIGVTQQTGLQAQYAYRIPTGKGHLALGLQGGMYNWRADFSTDNSGLTIQTPNDPAFTADDQNIRNLLIPNFGAGLYFSTPSFYFGFSVPHILGSDLRREGIDPNSSNLFARQYRHYYAMGGLVVKLSETVDFKPSFLIKNVGLFTEFREDANEGSKGVSAPTEFDIDASLLFNETLWLGVSFRSAFEGFGDISSYDSVDIWASLLFGNGLRIGVAYDFPLTEIRQVASGSYEVMIGFDLNYDKDKIVTPRYF